MELNPREKPAVAEPLKKLSALCGSRRSITVTCCLKAGILETEYTAIAILCM
jgi:hypothetical protein